MLKAPILKALALHVSFASFLAAPLSAGPLTPAPSAAAARPDPTIAHHPQDPRPGERGGAGRRDRGGRQPWDRGAPGGGPGGPRQPDLEVRVRFDRDGDGRLDAEERRAARDWLAENRPQRGPGGRRFGPPGGFPDGPETDDPAAPKPRGDTVRPDDVPTWPDRDLFDPDVVRTVFLEFSQADWFEELCDFHGTDIDLVATMVVDGVTFADVAVHFRGNTSFAMARGPRRSLHLDLDDLVPDRELYGHAALNLMNNHQDPSQLRESLGAFVANRHAAAPRANLVRVVINGEDHGVYSNVEHFDKDFLEAHFGTRKGSRFKVPPDFSGRGALVDLGPDRAAYERQFEIKSKDDPAAWARLQQLCRLLAEADDEELMRELPHLLDIDGTLWFLAIDNALLDGDGYYSRGSDYALWLDPGGRFHPLPRDGNEILGTGPGGGPGMRGGPGGGRNGFPGRDDPQGRPDRPDRPDRDDPPPGAGGRRGPPGGSRRGPRGMRHPEIDQPALALRDDPNRPLVRRLLGVPELRQRYLAFLHTLAAETLDPATIGPRLDAWQRAIDPLVQRDVHSPGGHRAFARALQKDADDSLPGVIERRRQRLLADPDLGGPWPHLEPARHAFVAGRGGGPAVFVTAKTDAPTATLHVARGKWSPFAAVPMADDGAHGDGAAGDGVFGARIEATTGGTAADATDAGGTLRYWVEARDRDGRVACWPASGGVRPTVFAWPDRSGGKPGKPGRR